jgi:hypothetical protein
MVSFSDSLTRGLEVVVFAAMEHPYAIHMDGLGMVSRPGVAI